MVTWHSSSCQADLMQFRAILHRSMSPMRSGHSVLCLALYQVTEHNVVCVTKWFSYRLALHSRGPSSVPAWLRAVYDYDRWCRQRANLSSLESPWWLWHNTSRTLWEGICGDDCRLRIMTVQARWKQKNQSTHTILSFIIAYHKKEQAHAEKNNNTKDSYSANILFKEHHSQPTLNPYNLNLNSMPALYSFQLSHPNSWSISTFRCILAGGGSRWRRICSRDGYITARWSQ